MNRILLLVDQRARDLASVLLIGEYLRELGVRVAYCNKSNMVASYETFRPHVLVLSCTEGQYKDLACYAATRCKIVLMTQEGACATKDSTVLRHTMQGMGEETFIQGLSRVYLWSEISKQWLLEERVYPESIIRVFGTSRVDAYRQAKPGQVGEGGRIRVGFANRASYINRAVKLNPIREIDEYRAPTGAHRAYLSPDREWEDWIWHTMASVRVNLDLIEKLAASGRYDIVFRPDPYEDYTAYEYLARKYSCFRLNVDPILANFVDGIDVLVTEFSTTGIDALLVKKPVLSTQKLLGPRLLDHNKLPNHINPSHAQLYWQPADKTEFFRMLDDAATGRIPYSPAAVQADAYLRQFYNWPTPGPSAAYLIAHDLVALTNEPMTPGMQVLHQAEYRDHPLVGRIARRTRLPEWLAKRVLLRPIVFDALSVYGAFKRGELKTHLRMEYYSWRKSDAKRVHAIFERLKRVDATAVAAHERERRLDGSTQRAMALPAR